MKTNKNAFTLIELLAVIVILAIVALIATPIILGIINDAKEQANERSAENYIDAVEQAVVRKNMTEIFRPEECTINPDNAPGKVMCGEKELKVEVDGEVPTSGTIKINNGSVSIGTELTFKEFKAKINGEGKLVIEGIKQKQETPDIPEEGPEHLAQTNVKAVTNPTTGIVPVQEENGNITPGSEFKIKVNSTSDYLTFFVLSNSEDGKYVNLIAEQNITIDGTFTSELQDGDEWYVTSSNSYDNRYGPQTAYTYLSTATSKWTNIPIIESFNYLDEGNQSNSSYGYQSIITELDESTGKYITTIIPYSTSYGYPVTYENMRARLPYASEVMENTTCYPASNGSCPLWMVNYLFSDSVSEQYYNEVNGKVDSTGNNNGYWLLSSFSSVSSSARVVINYGRVDNNLTKLTFNGIRPVITVLKFDLLRVMK